MVRPFRPASILGLVALCKAVTLNAAGIDATVLVQLSRVSGQDTEDEKDDSKELWYVEGGLPDDITPYAYERFPPGMTVESRAKDGTWLPAVVISEGTGNLWNVHVSDDFPGYDVSNVPYQLIRRELVPGESDWYMDNTWLHHKGFGINFRSNKSNDYRTKEYAPWGSLVVGSDQGDGWLKTADGYLPMEVAGVQVVVQRDREDAVKPAYERQANNRTTPVFEGGENVEFRSSRGDWHEAKILSKSQHPNAYNLVVFANGYEQLPVLHVPWSRLRKPAPLHTAQSSGSPTCQGENCLLVRARSSGKGDMLLHLAKDVKMDTLLKPACKKFFNIEWSECQERATVVHQGQTLPVTLRVDETGLEDLNTVDIQLAANGV